ncbi:hypothetical protein E2986_11163 [Frieseomelitta varia]|uniref:Uncharacterized protein n=1 Tax=Frieseomelitta varia TaxID=561572 RepID=A0A833RR68_9HYME|nr:hypothetical protein E2986_11163 [Frieseomelitta varia]
MIFLHPESHGAEEITPSCQQVDQSIVWLKGNIQLSSNWQCDMLHFAIAKQYTDTTVRVIAIEKMWRTLPVTSGPLTVLVLFITIVSSNFYKQQTMIYESASSRPNYLCPKVVI